VEVIEVAFCLLASASARRCSINSGEALRQARVCLAFGGREAIFKISATLDEAERWRAGGRWIGRRGEPERPSTWSDPLSSDQKGDPVGIRTGFFVLK
jgi:hypothetical protein